MTIVAEVTYMPRMAAVPPWWSRPMDTSMAFFMAFGVGVGAAIGAAMGNVPIGIAVGIAVGGAVGYLRPEARRKRSERDNDKGPPA